MKTTSKIFKLIRWAAPKQAKIAPPIFHEGQLISYKAESAPASRDCLIAQFNASDDLSSCNLPGKNQSWLIEVTEIEVRKCTIGSGNTCPWADELFVELLATCYD